MRRRLGLLLAAVVIGAVNAIVLKSFEAAVNDGTHDIWDNVFHTDTNRWAVVPLAIALGIAFSGVLVITRQKRIVKPKLNPMEEDEDAPTPTLAMIGIIVVVGLCSLWAGASLGPEASLVAISSGLGLWLASRANFGPDAKLLEAASIGALLVAFLGSYVLVAIPLVVLLRNKQLTVFSAVIVLAAGATSFGTLWLIDRNTAGFGTIPTTTSLSGVDYAVAAGLGFVAACLGWLLKHSVTVMHTNAKRLDARLAWPLAGAAFGTVVGLAYLVGGESSEFSGNKGSVLILQHTPPYGLAALCAILIAKLVATSWSLATGYRGGLVFPTIYVGVTIALIAEAMFSSTGPGVTIGSIAGVFAAMTGPAVGFIFIAGLVPAKLLGVAVVGILGAVVGNRLCSRLGTPVPT